MQWIQNLRLPERPAAADGHVGPQPVQLGGAGLLTTPPRPDGDVQFSDLPELGRLARPVHPYRGCRSSCRSSPSRQPSTRSSTSTSTRQSQRSGSPTHCGSRGSWHRIYALGWIHVYDVAARELRRADDGCRAHPSPASPRSSTDSRSRSVTAHPAPARAADAETAQTARSTETAEGRAGSQVSDRDR